MLELKILILKTLVQTFKTPKRFLEEISTLRCKQPSHDLKTDAINVSNKLRGYQSQSLFKLSIFKLLLSDKNLNGKEAKRKKHRKTRIELHRKVRNRKNKSSDSTSWRKERKKMNTHSVNGKVASINQIKLLKWKFYTNI